MARINNGNDPIMDCKIRMRAAKWAAMSDKEKARALDYNHRMRRAAKWERVILLLPVLAAAVFGA